MERLRSVGAVIAIITVVVCILGLGGILPASAALTYGLIGALAVALLVG